MTALGAALGVLISGCGGDEEAPGGNPDPTSAAERFIKSVATADPAACDVMTADGIELVEAASGEANCEEAIESRTSYLTNAFSSAKPDDLTARLEEGVLDTSGTETEFRFCTGNETHVTLDLVEGSQGWRVDLMMVGQEVFTDSADNDRVQPCRVTSKPAKAGGSDPLPGG
jgi:hypothetical protein